MKLPKTFKKKWLDALRSGKYQQIKKTLYGSGSYCCLGVAGRICGLTPGQLDDTDFGTYWQDAHPKIKSKLPKQLLYTDNKENNDIIDVLVQMNDSGANFNEIADHIDEHH